MRILIAEDDRKVASFLEKGLREEGYSVDIAHDGADGATKALVHDYDLLLLDVMMPGKSGWEVARALKQDPVTQSIKIVMVTAIGEQVNEMTSPLYGADAHIDKPFEFEKLEQIVTSLLA